MNNYQPHSFVEQNFIKDCNTISPHIDPNIFLSRYNKFSKDYLPFFEKDLLNLHKSIRCKFPNDEYALKGRIKSKFSFCKKTIEKLNCYFNYDNEENTKMQKKLETYIENVLKTFDNPNELIAILRNRSISSHTKLDIIYNKLNKNDQNKLTFFLGLCDDIYAYRLIIRSVGFNIENPYFNHNKLYIKDLEGNEILIEPSLKISNPELINEIKNILSSKNVDETRIFMNIHGKKEEINLNNIERNNDKSLKFNEDGSLTLLRDAIELKDGSIINITPQNIIKIENEAYLKDDSIGIIPINHLILKKYDEPSIIKELYQMLSYINDTMIDKEFNSNESMIAAQGRYKDYIKNPKPSGYSSIHSTFLKMFYNPKIEKFQTAYSEEMQARTLQMESDMKNPKSKISHNNYKSSTDDLSELVKNPNIELSDLFPNYILVTSFPSKDGATTTSWKPSLRYSIEHVLPDEDYEKLILERASDDTVFETLEYDNEIER